MGAKACVSGLLLSLLALSVVGIGAHAQARRAADSSGHPVAAARSGQAEGISRNRRAALQAFPGAQLVQGGLLLPLTPRHNVARGRGLLRSGVLPVDGSVSEVGYFYAKVALGTPPRHFELIIDTGSTITYVPCADCGKNCGTHKDSAFDPKNSNTSRMLGCAPKEPKCNCGSPRCTCIDNKCSFTRAYAEGSSSRGVLVEDVFAFPDVADRVWNDSSSHLRMVFGCEEKETGEIYKQRADGLLGMGDNDNSFQSQLMRMGVIEDTFSLCFGYPHGGVLLLGDVDFPGSENTLYTPMIRRPSLHYYTLLLDKITVDGQQVNVDKGVYDRGYGTVIDSGTTFMYLPSAAFSSFASLVKDAAKKSGLKSRQGPDPRYPDICWTGAPEDVKQLPRYFPAVEMAFAGGMVLPLRPLQYLFYIGYSSYCLGVFDNGNSGTLIGGIAVRNVLTQYDRHQNRMGFLSVDSCEDVHIAIASTAKSPMSPSKSESRKGLHPSPPLPAQPVQGPQPSPPSDAPTPSTTDRPKRTDSSDEGSSDGPGSGAKSGGDSESSDDDRGGQWESKNDWEVSSSTVQAVILALMVALVLSMLVAAAFVYRGEIVAKYNQLRVGAQEPGQELVSPGTLYSRV